MRTVIACAVVLVILITGCGMELKPTQEKAYRDETETMKKVKEHQALQLEIMRINTEIARLKVEVEKKMPTYRLAPDTQLPDEGVPE